MKITFYHDLTIDYLRKRKIYGTRLREYINFSHEWTQVTGELMPGGKNAKRRQAEQEAYDFYIVKEYEQKFLNGRYNKRKKR